MPKYTYTCPKCIKTFDSFSTIATRNEPVDCECGGKAVRNPEKELAGMGDVDATCMEHERWSWAMGVHVDQISEMTRKYPDRKYHPETGQLLVKSRVHKKQLMKEHGFEEY